MIDTILFDFDGTIMDTNNVILQSWQHTFRTLRGREGDVGYILSTFGEPLEDSMRNTFPEVPVEVSVETYRSWHHENFVDMIRLFPGITELLEEVKARGYKTGISTSRVKSSLYMGLEKYDLEKYFDAILTVEDIERAKPHPDIALKTLQRLNSVPEKSVMIGDTLLDILCARNAGCRSVLVGWSASLAGKTISDFADGEAPDYIIREPFELFDVIGEIDSARSK